MMCGQYRHGSSKRQSPVDRNRLARDVARRRRQQEGDEGRNVRRIADAAERCNLRRLRPCIGRECRRSRILARVTGHDGIHGYAAGCQLSRQRSRQSFRARLGRSRSRKQAAARKPVFSIATIAMGATMATAILGASVDTKVLPPIVHGMIAYGAIACNLAAIRTELAALTASRRIVDEVN